ncbi:MAG: glycosyltransferase [Gemmatimonadales bacterium]
MSREREPLISVVVCTRDRAPQLRLALESLATQALPADGHEVLVVDNASTDDTREVAREYEARSAFRILTERRIGLCHARNAGWAAARGRYVAYFDDDAVAEPGWLVAIRDGFAEYPTAGALGGRVTPIWEREPPSWLSHQVALGLTIVDWSSEPKLLADLKQEWLVGANLAVPRQLLEEVGGFHPGLDRVGSSLLSSGDVFLTEQIARRGYPIVYFPAMAVRHHVPASRLDQTWFRRRYYWQGVSDAMMRLLRSSLSPLARLAIAAAMTGRLLGSPRRLRSWLLPTDDPARFAEKCWAWIEVGHIAGLLGAGRR